jgi:hypothetical protein
MQEVENVTSAGVQESKTSKICDKLRTTTEYDGNIIAIVTNFLPHPLSVLPA